MKVGALMTVGGGGTGPRGLPDGTTSWDGYIDGANAAADLGFDYLLVRAALGISATATNMGPALAGGTVRSEVDGFPQARRDGFGWMQDTLDAWAPVCARIPTIFYVGLPEFSANRHRSARQIYDAHYKPFVDVGGSIGIDTLLAADSHASARVYSPAWRVVSHMRQRLGIEVWAEPLELAASDVWLRKFGLNVLTIFSNGTLFNDRVVVANGYDGYLRRSDVVRYGGRCAAMIVGLGPTSEVRDAVPLRLGLARKAAALGMEPVMYPWGGVTSDDVAELQAIEPSQPAGLLLSTNFRAAEGDIPDVTETVDRLTRRYTLANISFTGQPPLEGWRRAWFLTNGPFRDIGMAPWADQTLDAAKVTQAIADAQAAGCDTIFLDVEHFLSMDGTVVDDEPAVGTINAAWFGPMQTATEMIHAAGLRVAVYGMDLAVNDGFFVGDFSINPPYAARLAIWRQNHELLAAAVAAAGFDDISPLFYFSEDPEVPADAAAFLFNVQNYWRLLKEIYTSCAIRPAVTNRVGPIDTGDEELLPYFLVRETVRAAERFGDGFYVWHRNTGTSWEDALTIDANRALFGLDPVGVEA